eukprot:COSAG01_NODE_5298_length_4352_cov_3.291089_3_plen_304_part_00
MRAKRCAARSILPRYPPSRLQPTKATVKVESSSIQKETPECPATSPPPAVAAAFFGAKGEEGAEEVAEAVARRAVVGRLQEEGNQLAEAGQLRGALSKFRSAAALEPGSAVLQELQAQVWMGLGEWWQAVQAAERATQRDPQFGEGWVTLARAQLNLGEFRMAVASFERGASLVSAAAAAELDVPADLARAKELRAQQLATGWRRPGCAASRVAAARREATMASLQDELPPGLCAALRAGSCVLYTGSGFSIPAGLPSWAELLVRVAREGGCAQLLPACPPESASGGGPRRLVAISRRRRRWR